jgi:hypothetical protein
MQVSSRLPEELVDEVLGVEPDGSEQRPACSSRSTAFVTLAGCTCSRSPIFPRGSAPFRLNDRSIRTS